jgi:hypothetical protein
MRAMLGMSKIVIEELEQAADEAAQSAGDQRTR